LDERLQRLLRGWAEIWGLPDLADEVTIVFSSRMSRALGNAQPNKKLIRLNERLSRADYNELLPAVLCHEFAHLAVDRLYGPDCRPHGREWCHLYQRAGYDPQRRLALPESILNRRRKSSKLVYEYRCGRCQSVYRARRLMKAWRCPNCVRDGLEGLLTITTLPAIERIR
jgi:predicted SprT family Zn-dependent metalloprotease